MLKYYIYLYTKMAKKSTVKLNFMEKITGAAFTKKFGLILSKTPDRSGGAGKKGGWGERNSRPALAFAAAEFRASKTGAPPKILLQ